MVSDLQRQRDTERRWNEAAQERMSQQTGIKERIREQVNQNEYKQPIEERPNVGSLGKYKSAKEYAPNNRGLGEAKVYKEEPKPEPKKSIITKLSEKARLSELKKDLGRDIKQGLKNAYHAVPSPKIPGMKKTAPNRRPTYRRRTYRQQREYVEDEQQYQAPLPRPQAVKSPFDSGIYTNQKNQRPRSKSKPEKGYGSISAVEMLFGTGRTHKSNKKQTSSNLFNNNLSSISTIPGLHYGMGTKKTANRKK